MNYHSKYFSSAKKTYFVNDEVRAGVSKFRAGVSKVRAGVSEVRAFGSEVRAGVSEVRTHFPKLCRIAWTSLKD